MSWRIVTSRILGAVTILTALWSIVGQILAHRGFGGWQPPPEMPLIAGLFCVCSWSALLLGAALWIRGPRLATYAIVWWAVFPLADTIDAIANGWWGGPFQYRIVLLVAVPYALATGLFRIRHVLPAVAVVAGVFVARNLLVAFFHRPKVPVWVIWAFGWDVTRQLYMPAQWVAGGIGVAALVAWGCQEWILAARRRARRDARAPGTADQ